MWLRWLGAPWIDAGAAQAAFDRQHARDELGTRLHLALACGFGAMLGAFVSAMEVALVAMALYWLVRANNTWRTWPALLVQPVMLLLLLSFAWLAVTLAWTPSRAQGVRELEQVRFAAVPLLLWPVLDRRGWIVAAMLVGFGLGHLSQLVHAIGTAMAWPALTFDRLPGRNSGWWDPAVSGTLLMAPLGLHGAALALARGRWRLLGGVGFGVTWLGLLATGTRGGWIAGLGLSCVVALLAGWAAVRRGRERGRGWRGRARVLLGVGVLGVVIVGAAATALAPTVTARAEAGWGEVARAIEARDYDTDTGKRVFMYLWAWQTFAEHPVVGLGAGSFRAASARAIERAGGDPEATVLHDHAHHALLHAAATTGGVGLLLTLGVVLGAAAGAVAPSWGPLRARRGERGGFDGVRAYTDAGPALALVGIAMVSVFDSVQINAMTAALGATCLALCTVWRPDPPSRRV